MGQCNLNIWVKAWKNLVMVVVGRGRATCNSSCGGLWIKWQQWSRCSRSLTVAIAGCFMVVRQRLNIFTGVLSLIYDWCVLPTATTCMTVCGVLPLLAWCVYEILFCCMYEEKRPHVCNVQLDFICFLVLTFLLKETNSIRFLDRLRLNLFGSRFDQVG